MNHFYKAVWVQLLLHWKYSRILYSHYCPSASLLEDFNSVSTEHSKYCCPAALYWWPSDLAYSIYEMVSWLGYVDIKRRTILTVTSTIKSNRVVQTVSACKSIRTFESLDNWTFHMRLSSRVVPAPVRCGTLNIWNGAVTRRTESISLRLENKLRQKLQNENSIYALSENWDQPGHPPSLISIHPVWPEF